MPSTYHALLSRVAGVKDVFNYAEYTAYCEYLTFDRLVIYGLVNNWLSHYSVYLPPICDRY
jgi:hypothetical protein